MAHKRGTTTVDVGPVEDFPESRPRAVTVAGREVVVIAYRGRFYAVRNVCPHQSASFVAGTVRGRITSEGPGHFAIDPSDPVLVCPWHTWQFRLETGDCVVDPRQRVRAYTASSVGGRVLIEVEGPRRSN